MRVQHLAFQLYIGAARVHWTPEQEQQFDNHEYWAVIADETENVRGTPEDQRQEEQSFEHFVGGLAYWRVISIHKTEEEANAALAKEQEKLK